MPAIACGTSGARIEPCRTVAAIRGVGLAPLGSSTRKLVDQSSSHGTTMISIVRAKIAASLSAIRSLPISLLVSCARMRRSSAVPDVVRSHVLPPRSFFEPSRGFRQHQTFCTQSWWKAACLLSAGDRHKRTFVQETGRGTECRSLVESRHSALGGTFSVKRRIFRCAPSPFKASRSGRSSDHQGRRSSRAP